MSHVTCDMWHVCFPSLWRHSSAEELKEKLEVLSKRCKFFMMSPNVFMTWSCHSWIRSYDFLCHVVSNDPNADIVCHRRFLYNEIRSPWQMSGGQNLLKREWRIRSFLQGLLTRSDSGSKFALIEQRDSRTRLAMWALWSVLWRHQTRRDWSSRKITEDHRKYWRQNDLWFMVDVIFALIESPVWF